MESETSKSSAFDRSTRDEVIGHSRSQLTAVVERLRTRVAHRTESQGGGDAQAAHAYLREEIAPQLKDLGFTSMIVKNPASANHPALIAHRVEDPALPTVLLYGHGDVQFANAQEWAGGLDPWVLTEDEDRLYGRGSADNKGQHTVNLEALGAVLDARGELGYNVTVLLEMAEEAGSLGLAEIAAANADALAADLFIGSDGPRVRADAPTIFLGSRGVLMFELVCDERAGSHHSGNWGGKLRNPATVLAPAIHAIVDENGIIQSDFMRPGPIDEGVKQAIASLPDTEEAGSPAVDTTWGEPGLTPNERVFAWNTVEVIALEAGSPQHPVGAIPGKARAILQIRYVVGTDLGDFAQRTQNWLTSQGITGVDVVALEGMPATRLAPQTPVVKAVQESIRKTTGTLPATEPNLGGTIPNFVFADQLSLPTVWIPHSYPGCNQHAANEHALKSVLSEGLEIMAGIFWDMSSNHDQWFGKNSADSKQVTLPES